MRENIPDLSNVRALVAEDEPSLRELLDLALTMAGAKVVTTKTLEEAMKLLDTVRPDVVLFNAALNHTDIALAQMTRERKIPTIALTARVEDPSTAVALRQHGAGVLSIFDHVELLSAVSAALKGVASAPSPPPAASPSPLAHPGPPASA